MKWRANWYPISKHYDTILTLELARIANGLDTHETDSLPVFPYAVYENIRAFSKCSGPLVAKREVVKVLPRRLREFLQKTYQPIARKWKEVEFASSDGGFGQNGKPFGL